MTSDQKILHVLSVIETANKIAAKDGVCRLDYGSLDSNKVSEVELRSILEKLSSESVVEVVSTPYDLWSSDLSNSDESKHYTLMMLDSFDRHYDDLYEKVHFGINNLSEQNHHLIYGVAEQIHQYSNIHRGSVAKVSAFEANARIWLYLGRNKVANNEIKDAKGQALSFLRQVDAIQQYKYVSTNDGKPFFEIKFRRKGLMDTLVQMAFRAPYAHKNNPYQQTKNSISPAVPKQAKSTMAYDDEHGTLTLRGITKKLYDPSTVSGYLFERAHRADGARLRFADLAEDYEARYHDRDKEVTLRTLQNARNLVNNKAKEEFGIDDNMIEYALREFWLNMKYSSERQSTGG